MFYIGASDAPVFAEAVKEMTKIALELGPNPLGKRDFKYLEKRI